ncbi:calcium/proton exchanger [Paenibacillus mucilaginosus]|uniref:Ca(2+)/H(+) antiporter n=3 Tax=Paenibacillus mucilaginosus TaxID=61624 RepID=H6NQZ7_9BACL|nr:calcium/proton exchanger [Paenibacillus mucilaginosus]AEI42438.1 calcium/proton antiporter, CaCA family [Paenibacillus mucilaginosus KNP414]AFC31990.1 calcium/proton antiporter, CaCA family [Paenibacillus mucilaginosus 3016]AFH64356.1 cation transporter [Paenibacillus mucilaginosus K02]MCG7213839.1 calcium/proton exchanger [Paenibacillus mucilaginosus]WDM25848.1 calcium/proton exchanger [Paenibacillus mucilaginosus]
MIKRYGFTIGLVLSFLLSAVAHYIGEPAFSPTVQFFISAVAVIFVAGFLGKATESVAHYAGERLGGFLNATFGNAAELIIAIFLVRNGAFEVVKASITGSIIGNMLLVLGLSVLLGGLKFKEQTFNVKLAGHNSSLMLLAVIALFIPAAFTRSLTTLENEELSVIVSGILIVAYLLWLYFSMVTHKNELADEVVEHGEPAWSKGMSVAFLILATVMVAFESEWLVSTLEQFSHQFGLSELFVGAFLIAIVGNAAEHSAAILMARKNKMGAAIEIAIGSSLQIALFVAPLLVLLSLFFGNPMDLVFTTYELVAIGVAAFIASSISRDGNTTWYEGVLLLVVYLIIGIAFYLV